MYLNGIHKYINLLYNKNYIKIIYYTTLMNTEELLKENLLLREENEKLKKQLENYNNSRKSYYEKNKDLVNEKAKERLKKIAQENPNKIKEYAKKAYLNKKAKLEKEKLDNQNI